MAQQRSATTTSNYFPPSAIAGEAIAVTAQIAEAYAQWLRRQREQYRLPTEAELEYAVSRENHPAWDRTDSRADSHVLARLWSMLGLLRPADSTPEFRLDGPEESDGTRSNFELVRAAPVSGW